LIERAGESWYSVAIPKAIREAERQRF
jgi:hypothetical protein